MSKPEVRTQLVKQLDEMALPPVAVARAVAFAIEQPAEVDLIELVIRPTAQA